MRAFELHRDEDFSGLSGVGKVCEGIEFTDGTVAMMWVGLPPVGSISIYSAPNGMREVEQIHSHEGRTRIVWMHRIIVQSKSGESSTDNAPRPPSD